MKEGVIESLKNLDSRYRMADLCSHEGSLSEAILKRVRFDNVDLFDIKDLRKEVKQRF